MGDEMDESYAAPSQAPKKPAPQESVDEMNAGAAEILVAKNKLPAGTKEGDTVSFRVSRDYGDELSLEPVSSPKEAEPQEPMSVERGELEALDTEKGM